MRVLATIGIALALLAALPARADSPQGSFGALPAGAVQETASAASAASVNTATLAAVVGHNTYLTGLEITGGGATSAAVVACTITGLMGGTITLDFTVVAGASVGDTPLILQPSPPWISNGEDQAIAVSCPSFGSGNTIASVSVEGYAF